MLGFTTFRITERNWKRFVRNCLWKIWTGRILHCPRVLTSQPVWSVSALLLYIFQSSFMIQFSYRTLTLTHKSLWTEMVICFRHPAMFRWGGSGSVCTRASFPLDLHRSAIHDITFCQVTLHYGNVRLICSVTFCCITKVLFLYITACIRGVFPSPLHFSPVWSTPLHFATSQFN